MVQKHTSTPGVSVQRSLVNSAQNWTAAQQFNDNVLLTFGTTNGTDWDVYHNGADMYLQSNTGGLMIGLAASAPAPDNNGVHIWKATAGSVDAHAASVLTVEGSDTSNVVLQLLGPNSSQKAIFFGEPASNVQGIFGFYGSGDSPANTFRWQIAGSQRLLYSAGAFAFQEATTISTTSGPLTLNPTTEVVVPNNKGVVIGHTSRLRSLDVEIIDAGGAGVLGLFSFRSASSGGSIITGTKSRTDTPGNFAIVQDNDSILTLEANPDDGVDYDTAAARYIMEVDDASPEAGGVGMAHVWTQAAGGGTTALRETMRLSAAGDLLIANGGGLVIGHTAQVTITGGSIPELQVLGSDAQDDGAGLIGLWRSNANGPTLNFAKSRGSTIGTFNGLVSASDKVLNLVAWADDGTQVIKVAEIYAAMGVTPAAGDMPSDWIFTTTPEGSTTAAERMRIDSTGLVTLATGGIKFPATQVASSDANALDDYEEGTWTPAVAYSSDIGDADDIIQGGFYTKVGNLVTISCRLRWTQNSASGDITVTGLPFTSNSTTNTDRAYAVAGQGMVSAVDGVLAYIGANTTVVSLFEGNAGNMQNIDDGNDSATNTLNFGAQYIV